MSKVDRARVVALALRFQHVIFLLACFLIAATVRAEESKCTIVYGKDWSFFFATPSGWKVECPANDPSGVVVALWPDGTPWADARGVMYVTVSEKDGFSLEQFAEDELTHFRQQSPNLLVEVSDPIALPNKSRALVRKLTRDQYGNHELVAYADAGTVYLILVLSVRTQQEFDRLRPTFGEFVSSVGPMTIEFRNTAKVPMATTDATAQPPSLEFSFSGRTPNTDPGHPVQVVAGVDPGIPVLFDTSSPGRAILRPAKKGEMTNEARPVYRFEWDGQKSAHFYELANPSVLEALSEQNTKDTASAEGKAYEQKIIETYFSQGKVLQTCLPANKSFDGTLTAFVVIDASGRQEQAVVLPEGSIAECIKKEAGSPTYTKPPYPFTAKASIRVGK